MKVKIIFISSILLVISCSKKEETKEFPFDSFIFSYAGLHHDNSLKFTNSDTVFMQRRFPEPTENFYAIIPADKKIKLNKHLRSLNLNKFESDYAQDNLCDGGSYLINASINGKNKSIFIYSDVAPQELYNYVDSIMNFKENLKFIPTEKKIDFGDLSPILPPPPPLKTEK